MTIRLGVVMDPIGSINYKKDSTLAMLWEANARQWEIYYFEPGDLFMLDGVAYGNARRLSVSLDDTCWHHFQSQSIMPLAELEVMLMRKDPPFNEKYFYATYILEHAQQNGVLVVNNPHALRDFNEKFSITYFPQCTPPTLVTQSIAQLYAFWRTQRDIVCKPLNTMGGYSIFHLKENDVNAPVVFDLLTQQQSVHIMAQKFIPAIKEGDKRILMINGKPFPHLLARVPQGNDWRGNLAVGAKGEVKPLSERDEWICNEVGPFLYKNGIYFAGLDVIGEYLTEINITSPTGVREIDACTGMNVSAMLLDVIEAKLAL